jgi:hypothetical protein
VQPSTGEEPRSTIPGMPEQKTLQAKIIEALQQKIPAPRCPLCRGVDWDVPGGVFTFHYQTRSQYGGSSFANAHPCAAMVCQTCGDTRFISLAVLVPELAKEFL